MLKFTIFTVHMSSFLAVFLTVLVTRPQQRWDTQAGLPHPWVGVASGSHAQHTVSALPALQDTGRHPELRHVSSQLLQYRHK